jgi:hypothetical protein
VITCTTACSESEKVNDCRLGVVHLHNFWKPLFYCAGKTCKMSSVAVASSKCWHTLLCTHTSTQTCTSSWVICWWQSVFTLPHHRHLFLPV